MPTIILKVIMYTVIFVRSKKSVGLWLLRQNKLAKEKIKNKITGM